MWGRIARGGSRKFERTSFCLGAGWRSETSEQKTAPCKSRKESEAARTGKPSSAGQGLTGEAVQGRSLAASKRFTDQDRNPSAVIGRAGRKRPRNLRTNHSTPTCGLSSSVPDRGKPIQCGPDRPDAYKRHTN